MAKIIKSKTEFDTIINSGKVCLIDLFATWCGPCRMLAPTIDKISAEAGDKFIVAKVDVDDLEEIAIMYNVNTIPTLLYIKDGQLLEKSVGLRGEDAILNTIEKYI